MSKTALAVLIVGTLLVGERMLMPVAGQPAAHDVNAAAYAEAPSREQPTSDEKASLIGELMRRRGGDPAAAAQLIQLTRECSAATAAELFDELAMAHQRAGNLNLAAETRQLLIERFPDEPAAAQATLWLVRLYASSEVARAHRRAEAPPKLGFGVLVPHDGPPSPGSATGKSGEGVVQASASSQSLSDSAGYALFLANKATRGRPAQEQEPALVFQCAVAARLAGNAKMSRGWLASLKHAAADDPWGDAARVEASLAESPHDPPAKPAVHCTLAATPPRLDGSLDDACWQSAALGLGDPAGKPASNCGPAEVRLTYDGEFLYLAVLCAKATGCNYARDESPRTHDGDLGKHDRVTLRLDMDRDYATFFELVVDSRGWTTDRCWHDAAWNPEWFVAAQCEGACWTAEAAIPLTELSAAPPHAGNAWACQIERRTPSAGIQAWPAPVPKRPSPQHFGLLLFDPAS